MSAPSDDLRRPLDEPVRQLVERALWQSDFAQQALARGREEGRVEAKEERELLAMLQGIALDLMWRKRAQVTAKEGAALRRADEALLTALIVDLGLATDDVQLRAAVARLLIC